MSIILKSILWTTLGMLLMRLHVTPKNFPQLLGKSLYWLGVPLQIFALGHRSDFSQAVWLPSVITIGVLLIGWVLALLCWEKHPQKTDHSLDVIREENVIEYKRKKVHNSLTLEVKKDSSWISNLLPQLVSRYRSRQGSFVLASMLGNTGFIGLSVVPTLVDRSYWSWIVLYGVTHNILGSYGLGTMIANHFSSHNRENAWWRPLCNIFIVPALWAFALGWLCHDIRFPNSVDIGLNLALVVVVPAAFLLIGMQLAQLKNVKKIKDAAVPTLIKMLILPGLTGLACTVFGIQGDARLVLTIMSGMPTAFANAVLAEEYNLDREMASSSIFLSTLLLPITLSLWLIIF